MTPHSGRDHSYQDRNVSSYENCFHLKQLLNIHMYKEYICSIKSQRVAQRHNLKQKIKSPLITPITKIILIIKLITVSIITVCIYGTHIVSSRVGLSCFHHGKEMKRNETLGLLQASSLKSCTILDKLRITIFFLK